MHTVTYRDSLACGLYYTQYWRNTTAIIRHGNDRHNRMYKNAQIFKPINNISSTNDKTPRSGMCNVLVVRKSVLVYM